MLTLQHLSVSIGDKKILDDISCVFQPGKTYALMGPNGSGKSTLASALMGHPAIRYSRTSKIMLEKKNIKTLAPDERAHVGIFLSFQTPLEIPGVTIFDLLRIALEKKMDPVALHKQVKRYAKELRISDELLKRSLNVGFSGGEKKKLEALQAVMLAPRFALFDEIDTGVDVDALKTIAQFLKKHLPPETTLVFITHATRLLKYVRPDTVLVMKEGRLVKTGDARLAQKIEIQGFEAF
ncbi:MAG: Fe-S cluster assembly ATPase SufC [Candidatus Moranbacteria bacterium]|nr:Fe-S cluster assembly ATPase SufC [Candidatus Moranbacteria bacterium]